MTKTLKTCITPKHVGPQTLFNPPKPGLQSRALCGTVCTLSITIVLCIIDPLLAC